MFTKHFSRRTPIKVVIESDDPTQTAVVEDPTDQPAAAAAAAPTESNEADLTPLEMGPEEDVSESEVIIDDMEEESKDLNTAADAVDGLDAIADKLEGQVADGGATPETMEIVEVAVEHFVYALTKKRNLHRVIPSLESFGGPKRRIDSTTIAVEGIREYAAAGAKAIGDAAKRILEYLRGVWTSITNSTTGYKEKLAKLKERLSQMASDKFKDGDIRVPRKYWGALCRGGKFTKEIFLRGLEYTISMYERLLNFLSITRKTVAVGVNQLQLEGPSEGAGAGQENVPLIPLDPSSIAKALSAFRGETEQMGEGVVTTTVLEPLPGDVQVSVTGPGIEVVDGVAYKAVAQTTVNLTGVSQESDAEDVTIKSFTPNEAKEAVAKLEKLIEIADQTASDMKETIDVETKIINTSKSKFQSLKEGMEAKANTAKAFIGRVLGVIARPFGPLVRFIRHLISVALGVLFILFGAVTVAAGAATVGAGVASAAVAPK